MAGLFVDTADPGDILDVRTGTCILNEFNCPCWHGETEITRSNESECTAWMAYIPSAHFTMPGRSLRMS